MEFKKKAKKDIKLDITPIVDTVFILLIFFALSLKFTASSSLDINLPEISSLESIREATEITIQITKKGTIYINQIRTDPGSIYELLKKTKAETPKCNVLVQADENVSHGKVVHLMDLCKRAGFNKISIAAYFDKKQIIEKPF